jgi:hypothetical protein
MSPREIEMLRQMSDMPAGTIGFEASGEVDDDDFEGDALKEEMKFAAHHATA